MTFWFAPVAPMVVPSPPEQCLKLHSPVSVCIVDARTVRCTDLTAVRRAAAAPRCPNGLTLTYGGGHSKVV